MTLVDERRAPDEGRGHPIDEKLSIRQADDDGLRLLRFGYRRQIDPGGNRTFNGERIGAELNFFQRTLGRLLCRRFVNSNNSRE